MINRTFINRRFPISQYSHMPINFSGARDLMMGMGCPETVPMDMLSNHLKQVYENHHQGLTIISQQGGLCASEICAIMEDRPWKPQTHQECVAGLITHLISYSKMRTIACQEEIAQAQSRIADLNFEIEYLTESCLHPSPEPAPPSERCPPSLDVKFEFTIFLLKDGEPPDPFGSELLPCQPKVGETITLHYRAGYGRIACHAIVREVQGTTLFVQDLLSITPPSAPEESSS